MRTPTRLAGAAVLWSLVVAAVGCETLGLSPPANQLLPVTKEIRNSAPMPPAVPRELAKELHPAFVVEPGDVLLVQPADLDAPLRLPPDQTVLADGSIDLGVYGRPVVAGKVLPQIEAEVKELIHAKEKGKDAVAVTVRLIGRNSKVYYVLGEVNAPGAFPIKGNETVLDAIMSAGGITRRASEQNVVLSRPTPPDGCRVVYPVCYTNIVQLGDTTTNYQIQPGDRVYVPGKGLLEGFLPTRCQKAGPCNGPQVACWWGGNCARPGVRIPAELRGKAHSWQRVGFVHVTGTSFAHILADTRFRAPIEVCMRVWPGRPYPLGATWDGMGVNFALFSENGTAAELLLFDKPTDTKPAHVLPLKERTDLVFHAYLPDVQPGQLYGYRVDGPHAPAEGHRFNRNKVLFDPYAKAVGRESTWDHALFGYTIGHDDGDLSFDDRDSAPFAPLAAVVDPAFTWGEDRPPQVPWHETFVYELHVKGFTKKLPGVPDRIRGTYAGVGSDAAIRHLRSLNVTAVELLPVHYRLDDHYLTEKGLTNYWGYNTLGFFAPDPRLSTDPTNPAAASREFKSMVRALHAAGIEVILDVVYNHTAEGNQNGPTLSFRGVDNASYYHLSPEDKRYYMDFTGCGNTPSLRHPRMLQLIMDSLRHWVLEMHVDGFRFDLATALARELYEVDKLSTFFDVIHQDPVLNRVKLIAEPWDVGPGGYMVGNFPVGWAEWNGEYRDAVRKLWAGHEVPAGKLAHRLTGSGDLYQQTGRRPYASVNFVTCHDGFSLRDLVSYNEKHNEANKEDNRDGSNDNLSWNCGAEGPTDDTAIQKLRQKQVRNQFATLMLSQGVPMMLAGDEVLHTQGGNNNTYCHDDDLTWIDWTETPEKKAFLAFVRKVTTLWRTEPVLKRRTFFQGRAIHGEGVADISWFAPDGHELAEDEFEQPAAVLGCRLAGDLIEETDECGEPIRGDTLLILFNPTPTPVEFPLPTTSEDHLWHLEFDTSDDDRTTEPLYGRTSYPLADRSVAVFRAKG